MEKHTSELSSLHLEGRLQKDRRVISTRKPVQCEKEVLHRFVKDFSREVGSYSDKNSHRLDFFFSVLNGAYSGECKEKRQIRELNRARKIWRYAARKYLKVGYISPEDLLTRKEKQVFLERQRRSRRYTPSRKEKLKKGAFNARRVSILSQLLIKKDLLNDRYERIVSKPTVTATEDRLALNLLDQIEKVDSHISVYSEQVSDQKNESESSGGPLREFLEKYPAFREIYLEEVASLLLQDLGAEKLTQLKQEYRSLKRDIKELERFANYKNSKHDLKGEIKYNIELLRQHRHNYSGNIKTLAAHIEDLHEGIREKEKELEYLSQIITATRSQLSTVKKDPLKKDAYKHKRAEIHDYISTYNKILYSIRDRTNQIEREEEQIRELQYLQEGIEQKSSLLAEYLQNIDNTELSQTIMSLKSSMSLLKTKIKQQQFENKLERLKIRGYQDSKEKILLKIAGKKYKTLSYEDKLKKLKKLGVNPSEFYEVSKIIPFRRKISGGIKRRIKLLNTQMKRSISKTARAMNSKPLKKPQTSLDFLCYTLKDSGLKIKLKRDKESEKTISDINKYFNLQCSFSQDKAYINFVRAAKQFASFPKVYKIITPCDFEYDPKKYPGRVVKEGEKASHPVSCTHNEQLFIPSKDWDGSMDQVLTCTRCGRNFNLKDCVHISQPVRRIKIHKKRGFYYIKDLPARLFEELIKPVLKVDFHIERGDEKLPDLISYKEKGANIYFQINFVKLFHLLFMYYHESQDKKVSESIKKPASKGSDLRVATQGIAALGIIALFIGMILFYAIPPPLVAEQYDMVKIEYSLWVAEDPYSINPSSPAEPTKVLYVNLTARNDSQAGGEGLILGLYNSILNHPVGYESGYLALQACNDTDSDGFCDEDPSEPALSYGRPTDTYFNTAIVIHFKILTIEKSSYNIN